MEQIMEEQVEQVMEEQVEQVMEEQVEQVMEEHPQLEGRLSELYVMVEKRIVIQMLPECSQSVLTQTGQ